MSERFFEDVELQEEDEIVDAQSDFAISGLTNSTRRLSMQRKRLLGNFAKKAAEPVSRVLSNLHDVEMSIDATFAESAQSIGQDGFVLDEQTSADLLKIAGACSAMRQQMLIIADTVSEFSVVNHR